MGFEEWKVKKLGDVLTLKRGYDLPVKKRVEGVHPILSSSGISDYHDEYKVEGPGVTTGRSGLLGQVYYVERAFWPLNTSLYVQDFKGNDPKFIYYLLQIMHLENYNAGSSVPTLNRNHVHLLEVRIPDMIMQRKISEFLYGLEKKITMNNSIITNLEQLAQTLFKRWFVDFEFPNENGEPYKSSGGEMVESELGMVPEGWETDILKNISLNFDRKRVPLSKLERAKREKIYPYYGAASLMDFVDDYLFEGVHVLLGEDGSVMDDQGFPVMQYVWGKFWVNNHAHVLKGKNLFTDEYIYLLLKQTNVKNIVTGAVQPKINQTNLNNIKVLEPKDSLLNEFTAVTSPLFKKIRQLHEENGTLQNLRDTLLPKLLSGEVELPEGVPGAATI